jgi:hypothetical protein
MKTYRLLAFYSRPSIAMGFASADPTNHGWEIFFKECVWTEHVISL